VVEQSVVRLTFEDFAVVCFSRLIPQQVLTANTNTDRFFQYYFLYLFLIVHIIIRHSVRVRGLKKIFSLTNVSRDHALGIVRVAGLSRNSAFVDCQINRAFHESALTAVTGFVAGD
jgi:hypothetical protein